MSLTHNLNHNYCQSYQYNFNKQLLNNFEKLNSKIFFEFALDDRLSSAVVQCSSVIFTCVKYLKTSSLKLISKVMLKNMWWRDNIPLTIS